jgi:hypothetical protein
MFATRRPGVGGRGRPGTHRRIPSAERAYYARKRRPLKIKVAGTDQMREAELVLLGVPRVPPACGGDA